MEVIFAILVVEEDEVDERYTLNLDDGIMDFVIKNRKYTHFYLPSKDIHYKINFILCK